MALFHVDQALEVIDERIKASKATVPTPGLDEFDSSNTEVDLSIESVQETLELIEDQLQEYKDELLQKRAILYNFTDQFYIRVARMFSVYNRTP